MKGCLASATRSSSIQRLPELRSRPSHAPARANAGLERTPGRGHAVMAVGYDDATHVLFATLGLCLGMKGYFTLPYSYLIQPGPRATLDDRLVGQ